MQDPHSVITQAARGHVEDMAKELEIGERRMYEILGKDNPYPKAKRLIRVIGKFNRIGVRQIRADLDAMFRDILDGVESEEVTLAEIHQEAFEAVDAILQGKSAAEQIQQLRELVAVCELKICGLEKLEQRSQMRAV